MDRAGFLKLLSAKLYPILREEGFKGSGTTLRRHDGCFHHIVHVQGSTSSTECYINLGAHLDFLPTEGGGAFSLRDFSEPSCSFRERLQSREGERWGYGHSETAALSIIQQMIEAWKTQGQDFFKRFGSGNEAANLERLVLELEGSTVHPYRALIGARIAAHVGDMRRALRIATSAAEQVGEQATGLRAKLNEFIRLTAAQQRDAPDRQQPASPPVAGR
jgi:hypothetical protein